MLVMLLGQSRVFYSMSRDGLLWPWAGKIHPRFRTPYLSSIVVGVFVAILATLIPLNVLDEMTSVGTLLAFVLVSAGVWVMRRTHPDVNRPFRTPFVPLVPILSILFSGTLIVSLSWAGRNSGLVVWLVIGLVDLLHLRAKAQQSAGAEPGKEIVSVVGLWLLVFGHWSLANPTGSGCRNLFRGWPDLRKLPTDEV